MRSELEEAVFEGFDQELSKLAGWWDRIVNNPKVHATLGATGAAGGLGALAGAVGGGALGAYKGYRRAKDEGESTGKSVFQGALGGAMGAYRGGALGGLAGAAGGAVASGGALALGKSPEAINEIRSKMSKLPSVPGAFARFGQRQVHGFTGWRPTIGGKGPSSLDEIRMGVEHISDPAHRAVIDKGLSNIPGLASALLHEPVDTVKTLGSHAFNGRGVGVPMKAFMAYSMASPVIHAVIEKPRDGDTRLKQVGRAGASVGAGVLTGGLTAIPGMMAHGRLAGALERRIEPPPATPEGT